jgi:F0F1-type ATP synthase gamma subunit
MAQKLVNQKHSFVLAGMFIQSYASQFLKRYHSVANCALNMEDLISNSFCKFNK